VLNSVIQGLHEQLVVTQVVKKFHLSVESECSSLCAQVLPLGCIGLYAELV
jgi:hypothetical protein